MTWNGIFSGNIGNIASGVIQHQYIPLAEIGALELPPREMWGDKDKKQFEDSEPAGWMRFTLRLAAGDQKYLYPMSRSECERYEAGEQIEVAREVLGIA